MKGSGAERRGGEERKKESERRVHVTSANREVGAQVGLGREGEQLNPFSW